MSHPARPVRILHVLQAMNRGGVETWLMHVLRHVDRDRFRLDFLVHGDERAAYDDEVRALGSRVLRGATPRPLGRFALSLRRTLATHGPYDVVHSHLHHFSGVVLAVASHARVPVRIAHSHNDTRSAEVDASWARRLYLRAMKLAIRRSATLRLAASREAAEDLFGSDWLRDPRTRVLHCCIDLAPFRGPLDRQQVRAELGIPADALVIGHVGRFATAKNHAFLLEVHRHALERAPATRLVLIGDGPLRAEIARECGRLGLGASVLFTGVRPDVPRLLRGALDVFVFPSLHEGLPLVSIEAQAAGLPVVLSMDVSAEAVVVPALVRRLPLAAGPRAWATAALELGAAGLMPGAEALGFVERSSFDITASITQLERLYAAAAR